MSLEDMFVYSEEPISPSKNLAINKLYFNQVKEGKLDAVVRAYVHKPGIILGTSQDLSDVNKENCDREGVEVVRRDTGGAAVYVDENVLCYSIICKESLFGENLNHKDLYSKITFPLSSQLGKEFSVVGNYYVKKKDSSGKYQPFAGHSMRVSEGVVQLDGLVHMNSLDVDRVESLINLRELYESEGEKYVVSGGRKYRIEGNKVVPYDGDLESAKLLREEKDEISKFVTLDSVGFSVPEFKDTLSSFLFDLEEGKLEFSDDNVSSLAEQYCCVGSRGGRKYNLGHCFVYIPELEGPEVVHYRS